MIWWLVTTAFHLKQPWKKGHHQVVWMQSGMQFTRPAQPSEDEYIDKEGNLMWQYDIEDKAHLVMPMVAVQVVGRTQSTCREGQHEGRGTRRPPAWLGTRKCSKCGLVGHNVRTCPQLRGTPTTMVDKPAQARPQAAVPQGVVNHEPPHEKMFAEL